MLVRPPDRPSRSRRLLVAFARLVLVLLLAAPIAASAQSEPDAEALRPLLSGLDNGGTVPTIDDLATQLE